MVTQYEIPQIVTCWSAKGGSGVTVSAAVLALQLSLHADVVLVDVAGDQAAVFGLTITGPTFDDWVAGGPEVPAASLVRLASKVNDRLRVVPTRAAVTTAADPTSIIDRIRLAFAGAIVVIDAGVVEVRDDLRHELVEQSDYSVAFVRPCYLNARRLSQSSTRCDGFVFIDEPGRVLRLRDLQEVITSPLLAEVPLDPAVARLVDAGRLTGRLPRSTRALGKVVQSIVNGSDQRNVS